jgi:hypothetical protein
MPRLHHATLEELNEEIERRDWARARSQEQELMIKKLKEMLSSDFGVTFTGQEGLPV